MKKLVLALSLLAFIASASVIAQDKPAEPAKTSKCCAKTEKKCDKKEKKACKEGKNDATCDSTMKK